MIPIKKSDLETIVFDQSEKVDHFLAEEPRAVLGIVKDKRVFRWAGDRSLEEDSAVYGTLLVLG